MFELHPAFIQPENEEIKIWRYLYFSKFVSLINNRRLYFSRSDKFDDPFEGSLPRPNIEAREHFLATVPEDDEKEYFDSVRKLGDFLWEFAEYYVH
jgi:hypothetical protein